MITWKRVYIKKHGPLHKDLEDSNPFDLDHDKQLLITFSTGFTSTADDMVDTDRVAEVRRNIQSR